MTREEKMEQLYELLREFFPGKVGGQYGPDEDDFQISLHASVRNNAAFPEVEHKEALWLDPKRQTIEMFPFYREEDEDYIVFAFEKPLTLQRMRELRRIEAEEAKNHD